MRIPWIAIAATAVLACSGDGTADDPEPDGSEVAVPDAAGQDGPQEEGDLAAEADVPDGPPRLDAGPARLAYDPDARKLALSLGGDLLLRLPIDGVRLGRVDALDDTLSYDPYFLYLPEGETPYSPPAGLGWLSPSTVEVRSATASSIVLGLAFPEGASADLALEVGASGRFVARLANVAGGPALAYVRLGFEADAEEGFYGLGNWHDDVNHRGRARAIQTEVDLAMESANDEGHVRVPLLIGTRGWGLFVESLRGMAFDVARQADDLVEVTVGTGPATGDGLAFHLFAAGHPLDVTKLYYEVTGFPRLPARWALGPWIWRDEGVDQAKVLDDLARIRGHDLAASGYWIDRPYASAVQSFDFEPSDYPDPKAMIDAAHGLGFRMALWHAPYASPKEAMSKPLYDHAVEHGFFAPLVGVTLAKWGPIVDFTNPAAYAWWQSLLAAYRDLGIEGYKLDYAEEVQLGAYGLRSPWRFFDGTDERTMHHAYQGLYHRVYAEMLPEDGGFLLCRTGLYGDQKNGVIVWPGDLDAGFQKHRDVILKDGAPKQAVGGLPASMVVGLSLGPSGFPFYGADTGGYIDVAGPPDKELFARWMEQTALSSVMQVGNGESTVPWETGGPDGYDEEMLGWYRDYSRLHLRLWPYEWTYATRLATDGRPIQRPFGLAHPETGAHPWDQYLFGDDLLVAPVVERGVTSRPVVFPAGRWVDWFDGSVHEGPGAETVPAPLPKLPLYLRQGGIVPLLRPTIDTLAPVADPAAIDSYATAPGPLFARVVPGPASSFAVFDGATLSQEATPTGMRLGSSDGAEFAAGAVFEVMAVPAKPAAVDDLGAALPEVAPDLTSPIADGGWWWEPGRGGVLFVRVPAGTHEVTVTTAPSGAPRPR
jgi:alpha-D-xyloside xylohydrolase